jgi:hypothetical protein
MNAVSLSEFEFPDNFLRNYSYLKSKLYTNCVNKGKLYEILQSLLG